MYRLKRWKLPLSLPLALLLPAGLAGAAALAELPTPWGTALSGSGYERIDRQHGVVVYKHQRSDTLQLAAEARIAAPPRRVVEALLDYEAQLAEMDRLVEVRVLEREESRMVVYQRLDLPLIDDRDFTVRVWSRRQGPGWLVTYRVAQDAGPEPRDGVVRLSHHRGAWQLRPAQGGRATRVRYEMSIDLAGLVPMWMVRAGAGDEVPEVVRSIARIARR